MPIYAYKCDACGAQVERLQKISAPPLIDCPDCGAAALVKQLTAAGFQLKGSGWYATDFKGDGAAKKKEGDGKAEGKADGKPDAKPESAPAANDGKGMEGKPADSKPADSKPAETKAAAPAGGSGASTTSS
jgi:putative FmdB family regulatory protein